MHALTPGNTTVYSMGILKSSRCQIPLSSQKAYIDSEPPGSHSWLIMGAHRHHGLYSSEDRCLDLPAASNQPHSSKTLRLPSHHMELSAP
ncbi:hypothetical protein ILYODFUR_007959 [Ilyodon furcidens]|uniref:Uncharacterized protein n=1 Tax=Ilyodon furcidens TaxID=33524 RepID=A0ABV0SMP8_9TELE